MESPGLLATYMSFHTNNVASRGQPIHAIDSAIISLEHRTGEVCDWQLLLGANVGQSRRNTFSDHRISAGSGDAPGDHATGRQRQFNPVEVLAFCQGNWLAGRDH